MFYSYRLSSARPPVRQNSHRHLRSSRAIAIPCGRNMGVLPEIRWFSSNECALGCTLGGGAGVGNGNPQVNVLCLLP